MFSGSYWVNPLHNTSRRSYGQLWTLKRKANAEYERGSFSNHESLRSRKLLLHKREINKLAAEIKEKGFTIVPLSMYFSRGKVKVEIGLAKGKKLWDKRESLKAKDDERRTKKGYVK